MVTGTRAEYGLLSGLISGIEQADDLVLQLIVTGSHLSAAHGNTYLEIEADGHHIDAKIPILSTGDSPVDVARALAAAIAGAADVLAELRPDIVVLLGDRYEIFGVAASCLILGIPIAHLHGGETTEGAIDESLRHAITKMSALHFVAAEAYRQRVVQMGENPEHVFLVGGLGVDMIAHTPLLSRSELEADLDIDLSKRFYVVTFHPETVSSVSGPEQVTPLLEALSREPEIGLIFTLPNADAESGSIRATILDFVAARANAHAFESLGFRRYLSLVPLASAVIGNSSSGLAEAPTFHVPTLNIGSRQDGRLRAESVIDTPNSVNDIQAALQRLADPDFLKAVEMCTNPYGDGGATVRIVEVLRAQDLEGLTRKPFRDIPSL